MALGVAREEQHVLSGPFTLLVLMGMLDHMKALLYMLPGKLLLPTGRRRDDARSPARRIHAADRRADCGCADRRRDIAPLVSSVVTCGS